AICGGSRRSSRPSKRHGRGGRMTSRALRIWRRGFASAWATTLRWAGVMGCGGSPRRSDRRMMSKGQTMELSKSGRLHTSLLAALLVLCTDEAATATLTVATRLFSHLLAAYVADADLPPAAMRSEIEAHCRDAAALARARLLELRGDEPYEADDEE